MGTKVDGGGVQIEFDANIKKLLSKLDRIEKKMGKTNKKIRRDTKEMSASMKAFNTLTKSIGTAATAYVALGVAMKAIDLGKAHAFAADSSAVFASLGNDIDQFRERTKGLISDTALVQGFNLAENMGISKDQFLDLANIADAAAKKTGQSQQFMFDSIVKGTARSSKLILDNLGIMADWGKAHKDYAKILGKTVKQMTDQEKKQAEINQVLEKGRKMITEVQKTGGSLADTYDRMEASTDNLTKALGGALQPALQGILPSVTSFVDELTIAIGKADTLTDALINTAIVMELTVLQGLGNSLADLIDDVDFLGLNKGISEAIRGGTESGISFLKRELDQTRFKEGIVPEVLAETTPTFKTTPGKAKKVVTEKDKERADKKAQRDAERLAEERRRAEEERLADLKALFMGLGESLDALQTSNLITEAGNVSPIQQQGFSIRADFDAANQEARNLAESFKKLNKGNEASLAAFEYLQDQNNDAIKEATFQQLAEMLLATNSLTELEEASTVVQKSLAGMGLSTEEQAAAMEKIGDIVQGIEAQTKFTDLNEEAAPPPAAFDRQLAEDGLNKVFNLTKDFFSGDLGSAIGGAVGIAAGPIIGGFVGEAIDAVIGVLKMVADAVQDFLFQDPRLKDAFGTAAGQTAGMAAGVGVAQTPFFAAAAIGDPNSIAMLGLGNSLGFATMMTQGFGIALAMQADGAQRFQDGMASSTDTFLTVFDPFWANMNALVGVFDVVTEAGHSLFGAWSENETIPRLVFGAFLEIVEMALRVALAFALLNNLMLEIVAGLSMAIGQFIQFAGAVFGPDVVNAGEALEGFGEGVVGMRVNLDELNDLLESTTSLEFQDMADRGNEVVNALEKERDMRESKFNVPMGFLLAQARMSSIDAGAGASSVGGGPTAAEMAQANAETGATAAGGMINIENVWIPASAQITNIEQLTEEVQKEAERTSLTNNGSWFPGLPGSGGGPR